MPFIDTGSGTEIYYVVDDFVAPWRRDEAEHVLLLHGMAESHKSWQEWVPHLATSYVVLRADLPGLGRSTIDLDRYKWSLSSVAQDLNRLLDALGIQRIHVVGAKVGGSCALQLAASFPDRIASVVSLGGPIWPEGKIGTNVIRTADLAPSIQKLGVARWARDTMAMRLGPTADPAQVRWWTNLMSTSSQEVLIRATTAAAQIDLRSELPLIEAPALLMTSAISGLASKETAEIWATVPRGTRQVLECSGYHISAVLPHECARRVVEFIGMHSTTTEAT